MPSRERGFSVATALLALAGVTLAAAVYSAGLVRVYVEEKHPGGDTVRLAIPAALVPLGLKFVPDEKLQRAAAELRSWLPAIQAAAQEFERCPDGPLVEVENAREKVRVAIHAGLLVIDVNSDRETVHVSFPVRLITYIAHELQETL
ncbi:MAG: hypothetical protein ACE5H2_08245 [Terriglobia bacterium]